MEKISEEEKQKVIEECLKDPQGLRAYLDSLMEHGDGRQMYHHETLLRSPHIIHVKNEKK
jgi:hypothetical protein